MLQKIEPRLVQQAKRRGVVLLVVLAMLALFASLAISFYFYADSIAVAASLATQAQQSPVPDADPELLLAYFLKQLLFDAKDDAGGVASALRGHSLMRTMWGSQYEFGPDGTLVLGNNTIAYNGTGRLHRTYPPAAPAPLRLQDDQKLINYTYFAEDHFLRDPERQGLRIDPSALRGTFLGGFNPPYTYPDLNNVFLAAVRADGTVLTPSYHRPWLFGPLDPSNPNWISPEGKYLTLRPRPAEHPTVNGKPGFPFPEDASGDVKNTIGPGGNDSVWLDLGFPVLTHAGGRRYKPLFAPLIVDLDGRVNLNVHGNVRGANRGHVSNQGWGPWEVNLSQVYGADANEWKNLFLGGPGVPPSAWGRYGPDGQPTPLPTIALAQFGPMPHSYGQIDFDGCQKAGQATLPLQLPGGTQCFPTFPAGYDNAGVTESTNHPSLYSIAGPLGLQGTAYDRRFPASHLEALLRHSDTNSPALTSDIALLCPKNFTNERFRRMVTTASNDLRRPGLSPWSWSIYPTAQVVRGPRYPDAPEKLVGDGATAFPAFANFATIYDDFLRDGRAGDAPMTRVDVNRPLPDYPAPDPITNKIVDLARFAAAQQARQELARDIFLRLVKATGVYDPTRYQIAVFAPPAQPDLYTLRWLAQWSVNIVDFIDSDDYSTPFPWARLTGSPAFAAEFGAEWVFGVEMPRVLINETYGEYLNRVGETGKGAKAKAYHVNLWVELFNPVTTDPTLPAAGDAHFDGYQLLVTKYNKNLLSGSDMNNVLGDPDNTSATQQYKSTQVYHIIDSFQPALIEASDKPTGGFYVLGPPNPPTGVDAWNPGAGFGTMRTPALHYQFPIGTNPVMTPAPPSLLLRRLACPALPWQPRMAIDSPLTPYNPYVTVDYVENIALNKGTTNNGTSLVSKPIALKERFSQGRAQPYNGHPQYNLQQAPMPALVNQPQHTFFAHNHDIVFTPRQPFDWLVHLDRQVISPMELIHVASCRPHLVTHFFRDTLNDSYTPFNHAPYWLVRTENSPLHRALEFLETGCRARGAAGSDQIPGKINLNTIWDPEIFRALCDAQPSNYFAPADVEQIYQWMLASRTPRGTPGPNDRPFKALASANFLPSGTPYADGNGISDTLLRANPLHPMYNAVKRPVRLFEVIKRPLAHESIQDHPYQRYELLTKIFNQVTTRSHVFAVWLTVGFFEVNDASTQPVKLGEEIGRAQLRHVRHRMFALVDRSALITLFPGQGQPAIIAPTPIPMPGTATVEPSLMSDPNATNGNYAWSIQQGMILRVSGPNAGGSSVTEDIVVSAVTPTSFTANFRHAYPRGLTSISAYGNPGPRTTPFNPARHPELVPYFSVIR